MAAFTQARSEENNYDMRQATPQLHNLAKRLLAHEARRAREASGNTEAAAMEAACRRLHKTLMPLISATGLHALMARALKLAKREFPQLAEVATDEASDCSFKGVSDATRGRAAGEASDGFAAILANFIWLLVTFIGEDLTFGFVQETWSDVRLGSLISEATSGEEGNVS